MQATIFSAIWRKCDLLTPKINLSPSQSADLAPALPRKQEQTDDVGEAVITKVLPELPQLFRGQHPLSASAFIGFGCAGYGI